MNRSAGKPTRPPYQHPSMHRPSPELCNAGLGRLECLPSPGRPHRRQGWLAAPWQAMGALALFCLWLWLAAIPLAAADEPPLAIDAGPDGITLRWSGDGSEVTAASLADELPMAVYGGYRLPMRLMTVTLPEGVATAATIQALESVPYAGPLEQIPALAPPALGWEPIPALLPQAQTGLPSSPLVLLGEGRLRGTRLAVLAFSPIYQDPANGTVRLATRLDGLIPQAQLMVDAPTAFLQRQMARGPLAAAPASPLDAPAPTNPLANRPNVVTVHVAQGGIQRITAADLSAAGLTNPAAEKLQLWHQGTQIPLQILDRNGNQTFDQNDELRFYAPQPGDRWNQEATYWLTLGSEDGVRMASREVTPADAPLRTTALARGVWADNQVYESTMPGLDGDHYFHMDAQVDASMKGEVDRYPRFQVTLTPALPPTADGPTSTVVTLTLTTYDRRLAGEPAQIPHQLEVAGAGFTATDTWTVDFNQGRIQNWQRAIASPTPLGTFSVTLVADSATNAVKFDRIYWQQAVTLNFNGRGASFSGLTGLFRYRLSSLPDDATLYDVTDPRQPAILTGGNHNGQQLTFQDGPTARDYVVGGPGTLMTPRLRAHPPASPGDATTGADEVFIAPAAFLPTLQRLLDHRRSQGYKVQAIDVQTIYDHWSFGQVDPQAIRNFLRYAVGTWQTPPIAAVLVGDSTWDPHDYEGFGNPNVIPAYLANVDPWIYETACENCYAQLDGDDPLAESAFFIDIWLGRFPVVNTDELNGVIDKIISYETRQDLAAPWRATSLFLADDYIKPNGQIDKGGNFPRFTEEIIALQPAALKIRRHYFGISPPVDGADEELSRFYASIQPWLEPDPEKALAKSIAYMNGGNALVTYTGHSHHWQWAETDNNRLFGLWDVLELHNRDQLFIALSMTCYTAQFIRPADYHFTLDEHLFLHPNGGAVAVWGPAGLSVAHGHDKLQVGFYDALWSAEPMAATLGQLIQAGYFEVITGTLSGNTCCRDVAQTFLLLGDPLTPALVEPLQFIYLPTVHRQ